VSSKKAQIRVKKVDLLGKPLEVASQLSHCRDFIFLDSSGNLPSDSQNSLSIIAVCAESLYRGEDCNFTSLNEVVEGYVLDGDVPSYVPQGGLFGWVDYEGEYCFGLYLNCLIYDHHGAQWYEIGDVYSKMALNSGNDLRIGEFKQHMSRESYVEKVKMIHEYIHAGDIYQVNLTQKFSTTDFSGDLFSLYETLRESAPAPMAAYFSLDSRQVLSSSPETFLSFTGDKVLTRPIKGTSPRYADPVKDLQSAIDLQASTKENAELVMITDLERNDLGKVCEYGSVKVDEMLKLEKLEHVYHLVSVVSGTIRKGLSHLDVVKACFPGGSITGAPKKRAMEIISELEDEKRELYTGCVGYIGIGGVSQFNIVIRTLVKEGDLLHYHVGAGIVADSDPEAEYAETIQKAKGIQLACSKHR